MFHLPSFAPVSPEQRSAPGQTGSRVPFPLRNWQNSQKFPVFSTLPQPGRAAKSHTWETARCTSPETCSLKGELGQGIWQENVFPGFSSASPFSSESAGLLVGHSITPSGSGRSCRRHRRWLWPSCRGSVCPSPARRQGAKLGARCQPSPSRPQVPPLRRKVI